HAVAVLMSGVVVAGASARVEGGLVQVHVEDDLPPGRHPPPRCALAWTPLLAPVVPILGRGLIPTVGEGGGPDGHRWCLLAVPGQVGAGEVSQGACSPDVDAVGGAPGGELFG